MTTKIALVGDFHGEHKREAFNRFLDQEAPDLCLLVGDLQTYRAMPVPCVFIRGNHECWAVLDQMRHGTRVVPNLRYLPDGEHLTIESISVAGIGGNWSPSDKGLARNIRHDYLANMERTSHADIILSHETGLLSDDRPELMLPELRQAIATIRPKIAASGHHHHWATQALGRTSLVSLGKWPHEWATFEVSGHTISDVLRHVPRAQAEYNALLPGWKAGEQADKAVLFSLDRSGGWYGVD
jgi:predicted phosphodiesterase